MFNEQLPLDIAMAPAPSLSNFIEGENGELLATLQRMLTTSMPQFVYIWGESGVGKSHLAQAVAPIEEGVPSFNEYCAHYVVDDVDTLSEDGLDRLFALMNDVRSHPGTTLLTTGRRSPAEQFVRPDICTRLTWGPVYQVKPITGQMWEALSAQAKARGIEVTPEAEQWMQTYLPRDIKELSAVISEMDRELFVMKKGSITVPALKRWLKNKAG